MVREERRCLFLSEGQERHMLSGALYKATTVHPALSESVGIRSIEIAIGGNGK